MSCTFSPSIDDIKDGIIERETANIPLLIQRMDNVSRINIHEFVITQDVEPYADIWLPHGILKNVLLF